MIDKWIAILLIMSIGTVAYAGASEQQIVMNIQGMTCELCAVAVKKSLLEVKGVKAAEVSHDQKKARVTTDSTVTDAMLREAVQKAGPYSATITEREPMAR